MHPHTRFWCTIASLARDLTTAPRAPASPFDKKISLNSLILSLLARSRGATLPPSTLNMSFIPYCSVTPEEDERLPPLYFRPIPQRNLEAANIAHLPSAYVKDELRALRHRSVSVSLVPTKTHV